MRKLLYCHYVQTVIPLVRNRKKCRAVNNLVLSTTDNFFRESSYSHASVLIKCPFDCQCFSFAGHSDWQCHKSFQHDSIDR